MFGPGPTGPYGSYAYVMKHNSSILTLADPGLNQNIVLHISRPNTEVNCIRIDRQVLNMPHIKGEASKINIHIYIYYIMCVHHFQ